MYVYYDTYKRTQTYVSTRINKEKETKGIIVRRKKHCRLIFSSDTRTPTDTFTIAFFQIKTRERTSPETHTRKDTHTNVHINKQSVIF